LVIIPIATENHERDLLIVVLGDRSIERMAAADPAEVVVRQCGVTVVNPTVLICHEELTQELQEILDSRDLRRIITHLRRGFQFLPEEGDNDDGPQPLNPGRG